MTIIPLRGIPGLRRKASLDATFGSEHSSTVRPELPLVTLRFALLDALLWFVGLWIASSLRLESLTLTRGVVLEGDGIPVGGLLACAAVAVMVYSTLSRALRLHQGRHLAGSFEEMMPLSIVIALTASAVMAFNMLLPDQMIPRTAPLIAAPTVLVMAVIYRYVVRASALGPGRHAESDDHERALIVGAGSVGLMLAETMRRDPSSPWTPVAFLDDDPRKRNFRHVGVPVVGPTAQMLHAAESLEATVLVIATTYIDSEKITTLSLEARSAGLTVKIVPPMHEIIGSVHHSDLRDVHPEDLLGRRQVETEMHEIRTMLSGRVVLVTGAGGSIGSELCRQISALKPRELVMLDRDESALHALLLSLDGIADLSKDNMVLADIRDADRLDAVFSHHKPDVVFHAAALKHVNMLEKSPDEAYKTNVLGTGNVLEAAHRHGVERFVNVSTDKAAAPYNALGYSKRIAEGLTAHMSTVAPESSWVSVRFGNVLGTRGSVMHTFIAQIEKGGPVTVTAPGVTRFFMTVSEAAQLVLQAALVGESGSALVLDMGEPVKIADLAQKLIAVSGKSVKIDYPGLRPGEKLHEVLFAPQEGVTPTGHKLIAGVPVRPISLEEVYARPLSLHDEEHYRGMMIRACKEMASPVHLPIASGL